MYYLLIWYARWVIIQQAPALRPKSTCSTGNSDVFMMFTAVYTPGVVCTLINVSLCTVTLNVVQPDLPSVNSVDVACLRSDVPDSIAWSNNRSDTNYLVSVDICRKNWAFCTQLKLFVLNWGEFDTSSACAFVSSKLHLRKQVLTIVQQLTLYLTQTEHMLPRSW